MDTASDIFRVGISGSYGGLNLGDEAILQAILSPLRHALPVMITVFSVIMFNLIADIMYAVLDPRIRYA